MFRRGGLPPSWDGFLKAVVTSSLLPPSSELPSKHEPKTQLSQVSSVPNLDITQIVYVFYVFRSGKYMDIALKYVTANYCY